MSASRYTLGHLLAARSPAFKAATLEASTTSITRTPITERANSSVPSVQPLHATITSTRPLAKGMLKASSVLRSTATSCGQG